MNTYQVRPLNNVKPEIVVEVPGSKSITNRALLLAAMTTERCRLKGVLFSDDSRYFIESLKDLGFDLNVDEEQHEVILSGTAGRIPEHEARVYAGSAGTAARFLAAFLGLAEGTYLIDASEQMKKRPMDGLFASLEELGSRITYLEQPEHLPVRVSGNAARAGEACVDITKSSQFLSALLISGCLLKSGQGEEELVLSTKGNHGLSYVNLTLQMMRQFGGKPYTDAEGRYHIPLKNTYHCSEYQIEPDVSAACYFYALAAVTGGSSLVKNVHRDSLQGDIAFLDVLTKMGCSVSETEEGIRVTGPEDGQLHGVDVNMGAFSDQTMTLAAIAPFADSPVNITGIGHIRFQESNRLEAVSNELARMGIRTEELEDGIRIYPGTPHPATIQTYDDHRMAMAFSLTGLRAQGIKIANPECCQKTFKEYFHVLDEALSPYYGK